VNLPFVASVRTRPGMYIGDTSDGSGLHHMLWEVVANALDEHLAGRATSIEVTCNEDGSVAVEDDGAGMPVHLVDGISFAQLALTTLHTTATLDGHAPHAHVGLHGVGIGVVNALSASLVLEIFREGYHHRQQYAAGEPLTPLERIAPTNRTGTNVTRVPDGAILAATEMSS
jgi:DNA gyrase subunit B